MKKIIVEKGGIPLEGKVDVFGAKNVVLKQIAASLLVPHKIKLRNVPPLEDVISLLKILDSLGAKSDFDQEKHELVLDSKNLNNYSVSWDLSSRLRASFIVLGPLLARLGKVEMALPGGCQIGKRKTNLHQKGLSILGASFSFAENQIKAEAQELIGNVIKLDIPSNGATENIMMAAVLAQGETIIENAARDPEIEDLGRFLNSCGAKITGAGSSLIRIRGVKLKDLHETEFKAIPDRIEAGTFILAGVATKGKVQVNNIIPAHLSSLIKELELLGLEPVVGKDYLLVDSRDKELKSGQIETSWYPGFPTDLQPQMVVALAQGKSGQTSLIKENIYEDRFAYTKELIKVGIEIEIKERALTVKSTRKLKKNQTICGSDLRATAALVIMGLCIDSGSTEITGISHLQRGYHRFVNKLEKLGAKIRLESF